MERLCSHFKNAKNKIFFIPMDNFHDIKLIGEGTFGKVYVANKNITDEKVAIKKIKIDKGGLSIITIRELKVLKRLKNEHIVNLLDTYIHDMDFYMILEYLPFDLSALFLSKYKFSDIQIKNLTYQLLKGLSYIHERGIIHRDVKSSNILLTRDGLLKIADFGLSKPECKDMTNQVCTLWYRAPELLLGENNYDDRIDSWSVGCIFLEFKTYSPIFSEHNEVSQIRKIFSVLGSPKKNYRYSSFFNQKSFSSSLPWPDVIRNAFGKYNFAPDFLEIICLFFKLDFDERIGCKAARDLPFFENFQNLYQKIEFEDVHDTVIRSKLREKYKKTNGT